MDPTALLLTAIASLGASAIGVVTAWRRAPADNIATLTSRMERAERRQAVLEEQMVDARAYIFDTRSLLAAEGIPVPDLPASLRLADGEVRGG